LYAYAKPRPVLVLAIAPVQKPKPSPGLPHLVLRHVLPPADRGYAPKFIADSSLPVRVPICRGGGVLAVLGTLLSVPALGLL
jgi:hypothetical protein